MLHFAAQHRGGAAIAVVSNDQGFAPALARCSKLGAYTVAGAWTRGPAARRRGWLLARGAVRGAARRSSRPAPRPALIAAVPAPPCRCRAVGAYLRSAGFNWSAAPLELPVPQAANAIVAFHPGRAATKSGAEQRLARRWQRLSGARACGCRPGGRWCPLPWRRCLNGSDVAGTRCWPRHARCRSTPSNACRPQPPLAARLPTRPQAPCGPTARSKACACGAGTTPAAPSRRSRKGSWRPGRGRSRCCWMQLPKASASDIGGLLAAHAPPALEPN